MESLFRPENLKPLKSKTSAIKYLQNAFHSEYHTYIHELITLHGEEARNEDGGLFWEKPRVFPHPIDADWKNVHYLSFVVGGACMVEEARNPALSLIDARERALDMFKRMHGLESELEVV